MKTDRAPLFMRLLRFARLTFEMFVPGQWAAHVLVSCIPYGMFGNVRSAIYRLFGFRSITRGVWFHGTPTIRKRRSAHSILTIGAKSSVNAPILFDLSASITIGSHVGIGPYTLLTTGSHEIGPPTERRGTSFHQPIVIGDGVWIGSNVTILPGVTIGHGAVIAAGAVVCRNVAPNVLVGGVPAKVIRSIEVGDIPAMSGTRRVGHGANWEDEDLQQSSG